MATVGFIGSGQLGSAIAQLTIQAGHQVVVSNSRGPGAYQGAFSLPAGR